MIKIFRKLCAFCLCASVPFRRAFTLVELMVVLAVIGVLIMILLPPLQRARERARSTACQNNLRQYGIAMGRYLSDWKGYFIYPGEGGSAGARTYTASSLYNPVGNEEGVLERGGVATSRAQYWDSFIDNYLPKIMETNNYAYLISSVSSMRMCPAVQQELRSGNYFDPKSQKFKGFRTETIEGIDCDIADFEETDGSGYDGDNLILATYFTTYAINHYNGVYYADRKNISDRTIAFIDWNAKEGWRSIITYTNWMFNIPAKGISQDTSKGTNAWWVTEVGFHHKDGTNAYANYVAMDGHVASVTSNEISLSYFEATGPK